MRFCARGWIWRRTHFPIKKDRVDILENVVAETRKKYIESLIGHEFTVLTEDHENGFVVGYSENYIKFYLPETTNTDKLIKVKLVAPFLDGAKA